MRTWVLKRFINDPSCCAVWVELGRNRYLYILNDGTHGVADDYAGVLIRDLTSKRGDWEEVTR